MDVYEIAREVDGLMVQMVRAFSLPYAERQLLIPPLVQQVENLLPGWRVVPPSGDWNAWICGVTADGRAGSVAWEGEQVDQSTWAMWEESPGEGRVGIMPARPGNIVRNHSRGTDHGNKAAYHLAEILKHVPQAEPQ